MQMTSTVNESREGFSIDCMNQAIKWLIGVLNKRMEGLSISYAQARLLLFLFEEDGQNQKNLSYKLGIEPATIVRTADCLERDKFIRRQRSEVDRRQVYIYLTEKGKTVYPSILSTFRAFEEEILRTIRNLHLNCSLQEVHKTLMNTIS